MRLCRVDASLNTTADRCRPPASCTVARGPEVGRRLVTAAAMVVGMALLLVVSALQKPLGISRMGEVGRLA